jgi:predicted nuclease of predicted toxin-antitoxin system
MKLLFDENLSPKLPCLLQTSFPGSVHVRDCELKGCPDNEIWEYARSNDFTLISKDSDFNQRSLLYGQPPRLIWLRVGNCTREQLVALIKSHEREIRSFAADPSESVLVLI